MLIQILVLFFQSYVFAVNISVTEADLLRATGLDKSYITRETENALENLLFIEENGTSCGLEDFSIDGYIVTAGTETAPEKFEVITTAKGPANYCATSEEFKCYTHFYMQNNTWKTLGAECEFDAKFNE